jgi:hypothetical protein
MWESPLRLTAQLAERTESVREQSRVRDGEHAPERRSKMQQPIKSGSPGEKLGGRVDPDLMALKQKFEDEYWELLRQKILGLNMSIDELLFNERGKIGILVGTRVGADTCITQCTLCITNCNTDCIAST